jgi:hypothetical protein
MQIDDFETISTFGSYLSLIKYFLSYAQNLFFYSQKKIECSLLMDKEKRKETYLPNALCERLKKQADLSIINKNKVQNLPTLILPAAD